MKPLQLLSAKQIFEKLSKIETFEKSQLAKINSSEKSVLEDLIDLLSHFRSDYTECNEGLHYIKVASELIEAYKQAGEFKEIAILTRILFLHIFHSLYNKNLELFHSQGLAIILYMYSFTFTYFSCLDYEQIVSPEIVITEKEILNLELIADQ